MAHFAEVRKSDNKILRVIVISNEDVAANGGDLSTQAEDFVKNLIEPITDEETFWKQTSYNTRNGKHYQNDGSLSDDQSKALRYHFAGIDAYYDPVKDVFIPPQIHKGWILNTETWIYEPPTPDPSDGNNYYGWDNDKEEWIKIH